MNCDRMGELLDRLLDGELTEEERRAMEAHGRECPACAEAIRATMQMKALFAGMETEADVPLEAQARWRGAVKAEAAAQSRRRMIRWIASAAAAVVAVAGISLSLNGRNAPNKSTGTMAMEQSYEAVEAAGAAEAGTAPAPEATAEPARELPVSVDAVSNNAAAPVSTSAPAPVQPDVALESVEFAAAGSAVVEADGSAGTDAVAIDEEESGLIAFEESDEPLLCAAVAQRAPACELSIRVEDVDAACKNIGDLVEEYEGTADVQALADGGANIYVEIEAENAADFLSAVLPLDISEGKTEPPELSDEGSLLLLIALSR